jgi:hypothetical protein
MATSEGSQTALDALVSEVIGKAYLYDLHVEFPPYEQRGARKLVGVGILVVDPNEPPEIGENKMTDPWPAHEFTGSGLTLGDACTECLTNFRVRFGGGS